MVDEEEKADDGLENGCVEVEENRGAEDLENVVAGENEKGKKEDNKAYQGSRTDNVHYYWEVRLDNSPD